MKIAVVPSCNGRGHYRRVKALTQELIARGHHVSLVWDERVSMVEQIGETSVLFLKTPLNEDGPSVSNLGYEMGNNIPKSLEKFDLIISDTVTWPTKFYENAILLGQFTWDIYYTKKNNSRKDLGTSRRQPRNINSYGMERLTWPEIRTQYNFTPVPILDYWNLANVRNFKRPGVIGISLGVDTRVNDILLQLLQFEDVKLITGLEHFFEHNGYLPEIMICRAGTGIISECISAQIPMYFVADEDIEISFNQKILTELDCGILLDSQLLDASSYAKETLVGCNKDYETIVWPETAPMSMLCDQMKLRGDLNE